MTEAYQQAMALAVQNDGIIKRLAQLTGAPIDEMRSSLTKDKKTGLYILPNEYTYDKEGQIVFADSGGADVGREDASQFFFG